MATAAKKTAAARTRTTTRRPPTSTPDVGDWPEPLIRLKRSAGESAETERVLLFVKDWDDGRHQEFWGAKRKMASVSLKYMRLTRTHGDNYATAWALEEVLGAEAYEDLMEDAQLEDDELAEVFAVVTNAITGPSKHPKEPRR